MGLYDAFTQFQNQEDQEKLNAFVKGEDKKRDALKKRLDKGLISQEKYDAEIAKINEEQANKEREVKQKMWQRQHNADILKATADGIMATIKAFTIDPTGVLAGIVGATNAILVAKLVAQQMPEFAYGGSTVTGQSGRQYQAQNIGSYAAGGVYSQPSYGIIGEAGPELVIPNYLYTAPGMANTMRMLESAIGMREFARGGSTGGSGNAGNAELLRMIAMNTTVMQQVITQLQQPIRGVAYVDPVQSSIYDKQINTLKESSRVGISA